MGILEALESRVFNWLLRRRSKWPRPLQEFFVRCETGIMPGVDFAIIRKRGPIPEILLARRDAGDPYFPGRPWHITGGIVVPGQTALTTIRARMQKEAGIQLGRDPEHVVTRDILMGPPGRDASPRGQEVYRLFEFVLQDGDPEIVEEKGELEFFPLNQIPGDLMVHHWPSIEALCKRHGV